MDCTFILGILCRRGSVLYYQLLPSYAILGTSPATFPGMRGATGAGPLDAPPRDPES